MNLFGTDGIRNRMGVFPFTPAALPLLGKALARWAVQKYGLKTTFLVASDTRASCDVIKSALFSEFLHYPIKIYDLGVMPTPAVFGSMVENKHYTCGIIISASHNTAQDNGIKLVDSVTGKLTQEDELLISSLIVENDETYENNTQSSYELLPDAEKEYCSRITSLFKPDLLAGKKIILDCAHGATYRVAPTIFAALGADLVILNNEPDGYNINKNCGATHLTSLKEAVLTHSAFLGVAFDGDGDRFMGVTQSGEIRDGDDTLALLLTHPDYKGTQGVVSTIMANHGLEAHLSSLNKKLIRTAVGDKHVLEGLKKHHLYLGGEPSGHTIITPLISTGDGILVALKVLETMIITGNHSFATFEKYPQVSVYLPITLKKDLSLKPFTDYITASKDRLKTGRLLIRYSGTEPLLRIMVEDKDSALCSSIATELAHQLKPLLS
ncbi:phosphoglucosamine mutase [Candidatus Dependentiae bacterium]|nr:phosphoglucosamine mutase [Candidatus Dependentiae bacterium]